MMIKSHLDVALDNKATQVMNSIKQDVLSVAKEKLASVGLTESQVPKLLKDITSNTIHPDFKAQVINHLISELEGTVPSEALPKTRAKKATKAQSATIA